MALLNRRTKILILILVQLLIHDIQHKSFHSIDSALLVSGKAYHASDIGYLPALGHDTVLHRIVEHTIIYMRPEFL